MAERVDPHRQRAQELLAGQRYAVLSTVRPDGQPYASLVAVLISNDLRQALFATLRTTRKFENCRAEPRVALLLDDRANATADLAEAAAATVLGRADELTGATRDGQAEDFLARHPSLTAFVRSPGCALMRVAVERILLVTRFQNVIELRVAE